MRRSWATLAGIVFALSVAAGLTVLAFQAGVAQGGAWDDLVTVAGAVNPLGADGQATVNNDAAAYIGCLEFDAPNETAVAQFQLSHTTMDNTDIKPHIHWLVSGVDVTGSAVFEANFRHCPVAGTCSAWTGFSAGTVTVEPADVEGGAGKTGWTLADATYNFGFSDVILMQVRLSSLTVTDAIMCSADIHFQKGPFGSRSESAR
jgi:hypothetical protein